MSLKNLNSPKIINGGFFEDSRGRLDFINNFDFSKIKRFYFTVNNKTNIFRGWQGHKIESRWFYCVNGEFKVELIKIENWKEPSENLSPKKYILSADKPQILYIPNGYLNGFSAIKENSKLMIFSNYKLDENLNDEIRFESTKWRKK